MFNVYPNSMLRWIVILLIAALPLRSGLAVAQICPWMAAGVLAQVASAGPASTTIDNMIDMDEDCLGMSAVDGHCTLQAGCAAPPLLTNHPKIACVKALPVHTSWHAMHSLHTYAPVPQRIPIALT